MVFSADSMPRFPFKKACLLLPGPGGGSNNVAQNQTHHVHRFRARWPPGGSNQTNNMARDLMPIPDRCRCNTTSNPIDA